MHILLTNDDGYSADGLQTLRRELIKVPHVTVTVVAPKNNKSAVSHSLTMFNDLEAQRLTDGYEGYWVDGTPADCVRLVAMGLLDKKPDLVISGINCGFNIGDDIVYSGTVGAAREAIICGIPAIAISVGSGKPCRFDIAARFIAHMVTKLEHFHIPSHVLLNVNVPNVERPTGIAISRMGRRIYRDELQVIGGGKYRMKLARPDSVHEEGTDLLAIAENKISITPLVIDQTSHALLTKLDHLKELMKDFQA